MHISKGCLRLLGALLCALVCAPPAHALGRERYVEFTPARGSFRLFTAGVAAPIYLDSRDYPGVLRAAHDLRADIERVTKTRPGLFIDQTVRAADDIVVVGTLGKSRLIDELVRAGKLEASGLGRLWEAGVTQVVERPWPGVERALVIVGSDKRGTIYGVYELSEQIGVSPWYWWADVPVRPRTELFVKPGRYVQNEPAVKYRGIFINDEAPALTGWVREKFGGYNHEFYAKVFELLLRLKGNYLWPAMWGSAFGDDDPSNAKLADEYGVVMGTSHHEPMLRAQQEWKRYGRGPWDYAANGEVLRAFWAEGIRRNRGYESIVTLGMRGDGDVPMSEEANVALLERIVSDQRKILSEQQSQNLSSVPQLWALYKEVQEYYERGMRVPEDVTLLWCDDNWGNIRRLPTPEERSRPGGAGIYYHFDYVGGPRSYKWLNTIPITKVWEQMHLAYRHGADRIWIVNVGDIKPLEFPTEFFLTYAWDPSAWPAERVGDYTRLWAEREFGPEHAAEIAEVVAKYTKYNGRRKPELLEPGTYSLVNYREAETVVSSYQTLAREAERLYDLMPAEKRDAFFQLVLYPVKACAVVNEMYVTVGRNRMYAVQGRASTNELAERARELFREDERLARYYNEQLAGGKWSHLMDQTHIGYTSWQQPVRNAMPAVQVIQVPAPAELGVSVEGSEASWPESPREAALPPLSPYERPRYFEIFNRGRTPFAYTVETNEPWLRVSMKGGTLTRDERVWVSADWRQVPAGASRGTITVEGPDGRKVSLAVPVSNPAGQKREGAEGFVESDGYVSVEAEHYARAVAPEGTSWQLIPDFGRTLSGLTPFPVTMPSRNPSTDGMRLEYKLYLYTEGPVSVDAYLAPTLKFLPGAGLRYAVSFDDEAPQVVGVHANETQAVWERSVKDGVRVVTSKHVLKRPGPHVLKFWAVDPGLVVERLVVNTGGVRSSYLGPPESFRRGLPPQRGRSELWPPWPTP
ncbi:MAG: glycosyl hydrolase 115 family protein [Pyrinomonadaceae bacterium]